MSRAVELTLYLQCLPRVRFDWGRWSCADFAAGWVRAATGIDPLAGLTRPQTERACVRMVRRLGGMRALASRRLGRAEIPPAMAATGDIVLLNMGEWESLAICCGRHALSVDSEGAVTCVPMTEAVAAWRL